MGRLVSQGAEAFRRQLESLRAEYRAGLPATLATIESLWRGLEGGAADPARMRELLRALHSVAGSARTFGVAGVSEAAAAAESCLEPHSAAGSISGPAERARFARKLDALKRAVTP